MSRTIDSRSLAALIAGLIAFVLLAYATAEGAELNDKTCPWKRIDTLFPVQPDQLQYDDFSEWEDEQARGGSPRPAFEYYESGKKPGAKDGAARMPHKPPYVCRTAPAEDLPY